MSRDRSELVYVVDIYSFILSSSTDEHLLLLSGYKFKI